MLSRYVAGTSHWRYDRPSVRPAGYASLMLAASVTLTCGCAHRPAAPGAVGSQHALPLSVRAVRHSTGDPASPAALTSSAAAIARVQSLPLYAQARQACRDKQYAKAVDLLLQLSHTPGLNSEEESFCLSQVEICRRDAGLDSKTSGERTAGVAISTPGAVYRAPDTPSDADCGPKALAFACAKLGVKVDEQVLIRAARTTREGTTMEGLAQAAKSVGLKAEGIQTGREALAKLHPPAVAWYHGNHYVALLGLSGGAGDAGTAVIHDPNQASETTIPQEQLLRRSSGYLLLIHR